MTEQVNKPQPERKIVEETEVPTAPEVNTEDIGDLLDEIDEVLEENAEEFVRNYVQKGGE
jgi:ubiquitin-like protein Pup